MYDVQVIDTYTVANVIAPEDSKVNEYVTSPLNSPAYSSEVNINAPV